MLDLCLQLKYYVGMYKAVHFIGFDPNSVSFSKACALFGKPDFIHRKYDIRTHFGGELAAGDTLVFATDKDYARYVNNDPYPYAVDDSAMDIPSDKALTRMGLQVMV